MHPHLGNVTFDRLPVAEIASLHLPQARHDTDLSASVIQLDSAVLATVQLVSLVSRRVDNSVAKSIHCSVRSFMRA